MTVLRFCRLATVCMQTDMLNKSCTRRKLTRKEQRDLDIEITFMEGVVHRDPKFLEAWRVLSDDYSRRGKLEEGLKADEQLAKMQPDDPAVLYNLACSYALLHQVDDAMRELRRSIGLGFRDYRQLVVDPDLASLRLTQEFVQFVRTLQDPASAETRMV